MTIWVDADACPAVTREILCHTAKCAHAQVIFVSTHPLSFPGHPDINLFTIPAGGGETGTWIVDYMQHGDLVITSDLSLAADTLRKHGQVIGAGGEIFTPENILARLKARDHAESLRTQGIQIGIPPPPNRVDRQAFTNALDHYLAALLA